MGLAKLLGARLYIIAKLNRYSIPREKEKWGNPNAVYDRYDYDNLMRISSYSPFELPFQHAYDNELKFKSFINDKGEIKDYDKEKIRRYMAAAKRYNSLSSNLKSFFSKKTRAQRERDKKTMDDLQDEVYLGNPTASFRDKHDNFVENGARKIQKKFRRKDKNAYYKNKALRIYQGKLSPTMSQYEIISSGKFHQPENPNDFIINKYLFNIVMQNKKE